MTLSTPRLVGLLIALAVVAVVGVNLVQAVQPAVEHERNASRDEGCMPLEPTATNAKLGKLPVMAPDIQAQDYTGKMVPLSAYRGKVVLLNFWASWCPPCVEEMPSMDRLQRLFPKDLVVLAISSDNAWSDILDFFKAEGTKMTVLWDPAAAPDPKAEKEGGHVGALSMSYGTDKLPESYLIDRNGTIRYYVVNTRNWASPDAQRCIRKLVEE
jgi:thiol-disulfide isomerase/thioredoxin